MFVWHYVPASLFSVLRSQMASEGIARRTSDWCSQDGEMDRQPDTGII